MDAPLPKGCVSIDQAAGGIDKTSNIAGVVADFLPPVPSRGTDWVTTLTLCDKSRTLPQTALTVRIFRPCLELLPQIKSNSDLILLRNVKVTMRNGKPFGISTFETSWVIFHEPIHPKAVPLIVGNTGTVKPRPDEQAYFEALRKWWKPRRESFVLDGSAPPSSKDSRTQVSLASGSANRKRRFSLIRGMEIHSFYDLTGLVVKTFPGNGNFTVYLTDYSKNPMLHSYEWGRSGVGTGGGGDDFDYTGRGRGVSGGNSDWPGPWGQYTLQVTLWDVHAVAAKKLLFPGAYVTLRNVRAKRNGDGRLEGALHGDKRYPDRVDVELVKDRDNDAVRAIAIRKKEYTRRFESDKLRYEQEMAIQLEQMKKKEEERDKMRDKMNKNVQSIKPDHPITPISKIANPTDIEGPFANRIYKVHCKVIDYLPKRLEDFSVPYEASPADGSSDHDTSTAHWVWRFAVLVEGQDGATLRLIVEGKDAEYLLRMGAQDLRSDPEALLALREKLFVLWGNLEELTSEKLHHLQQASSTTTSTSSTAANKRRKRRRRPTANNKTSALPPIKRQMTDELGRTLKRGREGDEGAGGQKGEEEEDASGSGSDEETDAAERGTGKMFEACVKEYGVKDSDGQWVRVHRLSGTTIM